MITLESVHTAIQETQAEINGKWVPARSINHTVRTLREKLRDAWMVFTGKADALVWPEGQ